MKTRERPYLMAHPKSRQRDTVVAIAVVITIVLLAALAGRSL